MKSRFVCVKCNGAFVHFVVTRWLFAIPTVRLVPDHASEFKHVRNSRRYLPVREWRLFIGRKNIATVVTPNE